ncbi:hypothetical protein SB717_35035, partial [Priestia sp. SIMBA_032]|uniref:hypothetical protein n=1 Tax=Priestia sp. SIMBA_032 TaxID=3085775 RepID=UPI00397992E5
WDYGGLQPVIANPQAGVDVKYDSSKQALAFEIKTTATVGSLVKAHMVEFYSHGTLYFRLVMAVNSSVSTSNYELLLEGSRIEVVREWSFFESGR